MKQIPMWAQVATLVAVSAAIIAGLVALLNVISGSSDDSGDDDQRASNSKSVLRQAFDHCGAQNFTVRIGDGGHSILIDTEDGTVSLDGAECVFNELGTSDATRSQVHATTAMMGSQEVAEGDLTYRWSYHPDNGLNMTITDR